MMNEDATDELGREGPSTVLHVDDSAEFSELTATYLRKFDAELSVVNETDPEAALHRLNETPVDCVISDHEMPGMTGIELLERVRGRYPNLPFILFTGKGSEDVASEAIQAGVTDYLQKGGAGTYEVLWNRIRNAVSRYKAERRAKVARSRLLELYEQTDGFYIVNNDWVVVYWNQKMVARTGQSAEEVVGKRIFDVFPEMADTKLDEEYSEALAEETPTEFVTYYEPQDEWLEVRAFPVDEGLFVHSRDVSELKEQERELYRRNERLEVFANTVSHDLRSPLTVAEGHLELAKETGDEKYLERVANAHNRMAALIDELLDLSQGREQALDRTEISFEEISATAWGRVTAADAELVVEDDFAFSGDERRVLQIFENLFRNSVENAGGDVTVRAGSMERGFYVEDDGPGVPDEMKEKVFDPGVTTRTEGTGFGLAIVAQIADAHGWSIDVTDACDRGARFEITGL